MQKNLLQWAEGIVKRADGLADSAFAFLGRGKKEKNQLDTVYGYDEDLFNTMANQATWEDPQLRHYGDMVAKMLGAKNLNELPPTQQKFIHFGLYTLANNFGDKLGLLNSGNMLANMQQAVLHHRNNFSTLRGFEPQQDQAHVMRQAYDLTRAAQNFYYNPDGTVNYDNVGDMSPELYAAYAPAVLARVKPGTDPNAALAASITPMTELSQFFGTNNYGEIKRIANSLGFPDIGDPKNADTVRGYLNHAKRFSNLTGRTMGSVFKEQAALANTLRDITQSTPDTRVIQSLQQIGERAEAERNRTGRGDTRAEAVARALQDMAGYQDQEGSSLAVLKYVAEDPRFAGKGNARRIASHAIQRVMNARTKNEKYDALAHVRQVARKYGWIKDREIQENAASSYALWVAQLLSGKPYYAV